MNNYHKQPVSRRDVLRHGSILAASGTLLLAGCIDDTAAGSDDEQVDNQSDNASLPGGDGSDDQRESPSDNQDTPPTDEHTALVPMQLDVSLESILVSWDLPYEEMKATFGHVAKQLTIGREETADGPRYFIKAETWGLDPDPETWDMEDLDESLYEIVDISGSGTVYLYDGCHNVITREFKGPVLLDDGPGSEGDIEILASPDDPNVVDFWYLLPRITMENPGGPRGAGQCYDSRDVDEPERVILSLPGATGGIEDCYENGGGSETPRMTRIRGFSAYYLFSKPWDEMTPVGVIPDGEIGYQCSGGDVELEWTKTATFRFSHHIPLTPIPST